MDFEKLAQRRAKSILAKDRPRLSEDEQLKAFEERVQKGAQGFDDIIQQHGVEGFRRYLNAMDRIKRKRRA